MNKTQFVKYLCFFVTIGLVLMSARCSLTTGGISTQEDAPDLNTKDPITLEYWRLWDESDVMRGFVNDYVKAHPNITIEVKKIEIEKGETVYDYQSRITKLIADGAGPDMFMINSNWLPYHINHISPMPAGLMSIHDYEETFPQVVVDDFVSDNRIYAVPYYIDNLILFYNTDIFSENHIRQAPTTLKELISLVPQLTKKDASGNIIRSAIALGETSESIPGASGILAALMMQYGAEMTSADGDQATFDLPVANTNPPVMAGEAALEFYTQFANPSSALYTYTGATNAAGNRIFPSDVQAFMEGKAAMMLGYGYQIANIQKFSPNLRFATAPIPQNTLQDPVTISNYWGETVSRTSAHPNEAWDFINFMLKGTRQSSYARFTGRISARLSSLANAKGKRYYGAIAEQVPYMRTWYRNNTSEVETIFDEMIANVLKNKISSRVAVETAVRDINNLE
ncbi:MAG: extracellular solute-binding protein [Patescibacteria group bacterium]|nr:extracellular solute-binding protein [Patescibacteria group bacterium]